MLKPCSHCSREAELSIICVISTVGVRPRRQKSSKTVLFCHGCIRDLLAGGAHLLTGDLQKSVNNAYTRMNHSSGDAPNQKMEKKSGPNG
jgi:hypothetical protein